MKTTINVLIISILFLYPKIGFTQLTTGVEPIIENEVYTVHSELYKNSILFNTVNIFLFKGVNDTVWVFGTGYGDSSVIQSLLGNEYTTSGVAFDATLIDSVIQNYFGISNVNADVQFIVPHRHIDHINQELITELESIQNYNLTNSNIYIHPNDFVNGVPNVSVWNTPTLSKFISLGQPADTCNQELMSIQTSYGFWEVLKADTQHTNGTLNIVNTTHKLKFLGAHFGTDCETPNDWQIVQAHGNLNIDDVIILSTDEFTTNLNSKLKIYPNPTNNNITFEVLDSTPIIPGKILIYNELAKVVFQTNLLSNKMNLNLELQSGVYFVQVINHKGLKIATEKLIIK